ncbi:hypothetical protein KTH11_07945 [Acinetobacter baumannii]|uniref:hypothetical protein n=1 Tax=Acinetobacter baumannii TaxID=470 RepID=UPI0021BD3F86|nr:hypothetical protein [Acinetobacter baumannii]MDC5200440.1 hypothetical protein [Acinetobacter baumannii]HAV5379920.1 hypothetical protein [Acinetobacter baumannii]
MYIYINDDICDVDLEKNVNLSTALEHLINTGYEGINIIDMSSKTYKKLLEVKIFSSFFYGKLKQINDYNREYYQIYNNVDVKFIASANTNLIEKKESSWIIPLEWIKYGFLNGVNLIVEDNDDGRLLKHAIGHFQKSEKFLRSFPVSINIINGGGSNIYDTLQQHIGNQNTLIVCFCDSDKLSPDCTFGQVTNNCKKLIEINDHNKPLIFMSTKGREIENDIPHFFIEQTSTDDKGVIDNFLKMKEIYENVCQDIIKYSDLKFGVTSGWIKERLEGSPAKKFWLRKIEELKAKNKLRVDFELEYSENTEIIIEPICQKMSEKIISWLDYETKNSPKQASKHLASNDDSYAWLQHGKALFWLSIGSKKGRI